MAKPRPVLEDMPNHIKANIIKQLPFLDRFPLRRCSTTWKSLVDENQEFNFEKLFLFTSEDSFEIILKQNDKFIRLQYLNRKNSVEVTKSVNGIAIYRFTLQQRLTEVCCDALKPLFYQTDLTIGHFVIANLTCGITEMSATFPLHFTSTLERIVCSRYQLINAAKIGLFSSNGNCHRFEFLLGAIDLEVLSSMNIKVVDMTRCGLEFREVLTREGELHRLEVNDEKSIGGIRTKSLYDLKTKLSQEELWRHILSTKLQTNNNSRIIKKMLDELKAVDETIPEGDGRHVSYALGDVRRPFFHFHLQIDQRST